MAQGNIWVGCKTYHAGCSILTWVRCTFISLPVTVYSLPTWLAGADVAPRSIIGTSGSISTWHLTLARHQIWAEGEYFLVEIS